MGGPFHTRSDLERDGVEYVIVTLTNRIVMRAFLGGLDLALEMPTARFARARYGFHAARLPQRSWPGNVDDSRSLTITTTVALGSTPP
jgi:hypothetical protein